MRPYLCFAIAFWVERLLNRPPPVIVLEEVQALRAEVSRTREVVYELETAAGECTWQLWFQGWLLRCSGLADLVLIFLLIRGWLIRPRLLQAPLELPPSLAVQETEAELTASQLSTQVIESEASSESPPRTGRTRPTRPSDRRAWATSR